jgi:sugar lactone lactonase YvrE
MFGGARIDRYAASGELLDSIPMPCSNITKVAFGGADLRTVFVTTARKGLTDEELGRQPLAGGLFSFRVASPGQLQHHYSPGQAL